MKSKRLFIILLSSFLAINSFGQKSAKYHGESRRKMVNVYLVDSSAVVEYFHSNLSGTWNVDFDTLKRSGDAYVKKPYKIKSVDGKYIFYPGFIILSAGEGDTSLNQFKNQAYKNFLDQKLKRTFTWTGADLSEFNLNKWNQLEYLNTELFKQKADAAFDSLLTYYTSLTYIQKFNKLVIKDYRIFPKKYLETSNQADIIKIWQVLSSAKSKDRSVLPYLIQYPIPIAALSIIDFEVALLVSPITYPALIGTEVVLGNRIFARSTFKVIFYENGKKQHILKIRKTKIICSNYIYDLPVDFKRTISNQ